MGLVKKIDTGLYRIDWFHGDTFSLFRIGHRGNYHWQVDYICPHGRESLVVFPTKREAVDWVLVPDRMRQTLAVKREMEARVRITEAYKKDLFNIINPALEEAEGYRNTLKDCTPGTTGRESGNWWETRALLLECFKEVVEGTRSKLTFG
jgi:hypothetical protein